MVNWEYHIRGIFGGGFNLAVCKSLKYCQLNVHHLGCKHGFLTETISPIAFLE